MINERRERQNGRQEGAKNNVSEEVLHDLEKGNGKRWVGSTSDRKAGSMEAVISSVASVYLSVA